MCVLLGPNSNAATLPSTDDTEICFSQLHMTLISTMNFEIVSVINCYLITDTYSLKFTEACKYCCYGNKKCKTSEEDLDRQDL